MKVAILAGGLGTRLSEETSYKPKPMVEVGGMPILWHIMKIYSSFGYKEFVLALGYKGEVIKDYFLGYHLRTSCLTVRTLTGEVDQHQPTAEDWTVHLLDTGSDTNTGGRVRRVAEFIGDEPFMLTYGDGVGNIDIPQLVGLHQREGRMVTMTAVRPPARFGQMVLNNARVVEFKEKPQIGEGWINGGFFIIQPGIERYIAGDQTSWEFDSLENIAAGGGLSAYEHHGFWQSMDTLRDVNLLNKLWQEGNAPWKIW